MKKVGMLIIHGFGGTPCEVSELIATCNRKNWMTIAPLLPGHDSTVSKLNVVPYHEWIRHVVDNFLELSDRVDQMGIVGLSMGGLLALHLAATVANPIVPCSIISTPCTIVPFYLGPLITLLGRMGISIRPKGKDVEGARDEVLDCPSAETVPLAAVRQLLLLRNEVMKRLRDVKNPVLIVHSKNDELVPVKDAKQLHQHIDSNRKKLIILDRGGHNLLKDFNRKEVISLIVKWMEQQF